LKVTPSTFQILPKAIFNFNQSFLTWNLKPEIVSTREEHGRGKGNCDKRRAIDIVRSGLKVQNS